MENSNHSKFSEATEYLQRTDLNQGLINEERATELRHVLQNMSEMTKLSENRSLMTETALVKLCRLLDGFHTQAKSSVTDDSMMTNESLMLTCTWCLRCLRNSCVQSPLNQKTIWNAGAVKFLKQLIIFISAAPHPIQEDNAVCLRCAIQLLGNLLSGQSELLSVTWQDIFPQMCLSVFQCADSKASQYLCMVIQISLQDIPVSDTKQLWTCDDGYQLIEAILTLSEKETGQDFSLKLLQRLIYIPEFVPSVFSHLSPSCQVILLDIIAVYVTHGETPEPSYMQHGQPSYMQHGQPSYMQHGQPSYMQHGQPSYMQHGQPSYMHHGQLSIPISCMLSLAEVFEHEADTVFSLVSEEQWCNIKEQKKPELVMKLLSLLCEASCQPAVSSTLLQRMSLLECSLDLLDRANKAGKKDKNIFSCTQTSDDSISQTNPVFGFKRDLVRLIGNMCHNHKANQNKVRELHGIPVILEQSNIDSTNPFISQWAIFAIRNLCDGNPDNQAVVAEMTNKGVVNNDTLQQYGFQAEMREGKMYYKTTTKK
ncbi:ataxin-10-like isoform X1 [Asterias rubens]|uniref:ataxin-10-like isoform X1 n=2 Tax=Asterias rubens TaxID=7604 RepID=UPI0014551A97|nr:ataxin-10-like isoform X1 [Asterias rubens]